MLVSSFRKCMTSWPFGRGEKQLSPKAEVGINISAEQTDGDCLPRCQSDQECHTTQYVYSDTFPGCHTAQYLHSDTFPDAGH